MTIEEIAKQALADEHIEIMEMTAEDIEDHGPDSCWYNEGEPLEPGMYAWQCFPGCMPEGAPLYIGALDASESEILETVVDSFLLGSLDEEDQVIALMSHLIESEGEKALDVFGNVTETRCGSLKYGSMEYLVLTDDEADEKCDEYHRELLLDELLHDLPDTLKHYFDEEKYLDDCRSDRAGALASYDGSEYEEEVNGETYYIYRTN